MGGFNSKVRRDFAVHHLRAAARAAREARQVEDNHSAEPLGDWFEDLLALVPVSVVMAGAALEANASEIIQDILDRAPYVQHDMAESLKELKESRAGHSMDKYQRLALLFNKTLSMGSMTWNDASLLVRFRNSLMHFKPEWDDNTKTTPLNKSLLNRLKVSRHFASADVSPYAFMTHQCAAWSVNTVLAFSAEFAALIGTPDRFAWSPEDYETY